MFCVSLWLLSVQLNFIYAVKSKRCWTVTVWGGLLFASVHHNSELKKNQDLNEVQTFSFNLGGLNKSTELTVLELQPFYAQY